MYTQQRSHYRPLRPVPRSDTSSYHRPSPVIHSYGEAIGQPTKPNPLARNVAVDDRDLGEQHWAHCMDYASRLWMEVYSNR
jgi:hypothetical protein